ncbi:MAG: SDR family NAD(P)-dependent oxidoreductase [Cellvibrionaceae bacterium]
MMKTSGNQEVVWVTGASSGIGRGLAKRLAEQGSCVIASARSIDILKDLSQENKNITPRSLDVCDANSLSAAATDIQNQFGYIDKVIINAGSCEYFDVTDPDWDMMRRVMEVNYFGSINTVAQALPLLRNAISKNKSEHSNNLENKQPEIIVIASLASVVPFPRAEAYGSSKAALQYFFESLRVDLAKENIAVTIVQPGFVKTPLTDKNDFPMPFLIDVDTAVNVIVDKIKSKRKLFYFPKRLGWLIYFMRAVPALWHWLVTKQLAR